MFLDLHTNLYVADVDRSLTLYRDLFGMAETYRFPREGKVKHVELRIGGVTLALTSPDGLKDHELPPATRGEPFELAFECDDADAALAQCKALGLKELVPPMVTPAGNRVAYLRDFDGNRIQLYSHLR